VSAPVQRKRISPAATARAATSPGIPWRDCDTRTAEKQPTAGAGRRAAAAQHPGAKSVALAGLDGAACELTEDASLPGDTLPGQHLTAWWIVCEPYFQCWFDMAVWVHREPRWECCASPRSWEPKLAWGRGTTGTRREEEMSFEKLMNCGPGISHGDGGWGGSVGGDACGMNNESVRTVLTATSGPPVRCGAVRCGRRRSSDLDDRRVGLSPVARNTTESASSRAHTVQ